MHLKHPFPRKMPRESFIGVVDSLHKLVAKTGVTPDQLVTCAEIVRDNVSRIDAMREPLHVPCKKI